MVSNPMQILKRLSANGLKINKYSITFVIFIAWMIFLDTNNFFTQLKLSSTINSLQQEKSDYEEKLQLAIKE